jgi:hypothetical protein
VREWLKSQSVCDALAINDPESWRPHTAGAFDFARWARQHSLPVLGEDADVRRGDIVIYDFSHIGLVMKDAPKKDGVLHCVEGNTNASGEREGDGVWPKIRARYLSRQFIRLV